MQSCLFLKGLCVLFSTFVWFVYVRDTRFAWLNMISMYIKWFRKATARYKACNVFHKTHGNLNYYRWFSRNNNVVIFIITKNLPLKAFFLMTNYANAVFLCGHTYIHKRHRLKNMCVYTSLYTHIYSHTFFLNYSAAGPWQFPSNWETSDAVSRDSSLSPAPRGPPRPWLTFTDPGERETGPGLREHRPCCSVLI